MKLGLLNGLLPARLRAFLYKVLSKNIRIGARTSIHPSASIAADGGRIVIGKRCRIHKGVIISTYGGSIVLGDDVSLNPYTIVYGHGGVVIGDKTRIAAHSVIIPSEHNFQEKGRSIGSQGSTQQGITIGTDVWIASGVKVLDGTTIEDGCVIGANAVIKGKTEPYGVYVGVPAKKIKERV